MHLADVAHGDDAVAALLDRQPQDVLGRLDHAGQLDGEGALLGLDVAGGHQLVVAADDIGQVVGGDVVGLHPHRIDGGLEHLFARAGYVGAEHAGKAKQAVL